MALLSREAFLLLCVLMAACADRVTIKINRDSGDPNVGGGGSPPGGGGSHYTPPGATQYPPQTPIVKRAAAAYSAPPGVAADTEASTVWQSLVGHCLNVEVTQGTHNELYVYTLCPFQNVTQKKPGGSLHVVLGTWLEWRVHAENNNALRMVYTDGNLCSSGRHRQTTVHLICDPSQTVNTLANVAEPEICSYELDFTTPYACLPGFPAEGNANANVVLVTNPDDAPPSHGGAISLLGSRDSRDLRESPPSVLEAVVAPASPIVGNDAQIAAADMKSCLDRLIPALESSEQNLQAGSRIAPGARSGGKQVTPSSGLAVLKTVSECNVFRKTNS